MLENATLPLGRIALILLAFGGLEEAHASSPQPWPDLLVTVPAGKGWLVSGEVIARISDVDRSSQGETRLQVGHALAPGLTLWAGWVHFANYVPHAPNTFENQAVEQLNWAIGALGPVRVSTRTRLEQRYLTNVTATSWRWRQQVRATVPLGGAKGPSAVVWAEPFFALNRTGGQFHTLDQLRTFAGVTVPMTKRIDLEFGYLNQRLYRPTSTIVNDAIPLIISVRL